MQAWLREGLESCLGAAVSDVSPVSGGSINDAYRVRLDPSRRSAGEDDRREVFVKANAAAPARMFETEAAGLAWLGEGLFGDDLRVPKLLAIDPAGAKARFLVLEWIDTQAATSTQLERAGRGLASLHRSGQGLAWGLDHDNFIGSLGQRNVGAWTSWAELFSQARIVPLVHALAARGSIDAKLCGRLDRLCERLDALVGEPEPARLHGDLWAGNLIADARGAVLIDPAVYVGAREIDLAMLKLFGQPSPRMLAAYAEVWPLEPEWESRVDLYQLYPLLVHALLFGSSYVGAVDRALRPYV